MTNIIGNRPTAKVGTGYGSDGACPIVEYFCYRCGKHIRAGFKSEPDCTSCGAKFFWGDEPAHIEEVKTLVAVWGSNQNTTEEDKPFDRGEAAKWFREKLDSGFYDEK